MTNIKDEQSFLRNLWSWTFLDQAFDRGIRVTDIDGFIEANHKFMFIEGKREGAGIPKGQYMALSRLARIDGISVVILEGTPPDTVTRWQVIGSELIYVGNSEEFAAYVRLWFENAQMPA